MIKEINYQKCTGCSYPVNEALTTFIIDLDSWVQTAEAAPCQVACPAGVNARACNFLVRQGRMKEAVKVLREALPLPAITGHVCIHPCEMECARKDVDEAVNINSLERYIADYELNEKPQAIPKTREDKVAIVGSGPAGLSAAYVLAQKGFPVTVFEAMPEPGGMMRYGIPEYRLPRNVLDAQIDYIRAMGVDFQTGVTVGKDVNFDQFKKQGFEAVFIAIGAYRSLKLGVPGEDLDGVYKGLELLKDVNTGRKLTMEKKVVVIGGGNVAIDAARTAIRLGAGEVNVIYRRTRQEMPAMAEEVVSAEDEGVRISYLASPVEILGMNGKVTGLRCVRMELGELDASGRRSPVEVKGSEFTVNADTVVVAIGEVPDLSLWADGGKLSVTAEGNIKADKGNLTTGMLGVFAGGDAVNGPSSVVEAIASGKKAACYIARYLSGQDIVARESEAKKTPGKPKPGVVKVERNETPLLLASQRKKNFKEVRGAFSAEVAKKEAERCMICKVRGECTEVCAMDVLRMDEYMGKPVIRYHEDCMTCYSCELTCPMGAIMVSPLKKEIPLQIEYPSASKK